MTKDCSTKNSKDTLPIPTVGVVNIYIADIVALKEYSPRHEAVMMLDQGRITDYLAWACSCGVPAAWGSKPDSLGSQQQFAEADCIPLDESLVTRFRCDVRNLAPSGKQVETLVKQACEDIHKFGESPLEIAIRSGNEALVDSILDEMMCPRRVFQRGYFGKVGGGWTSVEFRLSLVDPRLACRLPLVSQLRSRPIVLLAILLGNQGLAERLIQRGWSPHDIFEWEHLAEQVRRSHETIQRHRELEPVLCTVFGIPAGTLEAAGAWLEERAALTAQLDDLFCLQPNTRWLKKVDALLAKNAPVSYFPLAVASERNDASLLEKLFAAGGEANARYKADVPLLARLDSDRLTPDILQIWLDNGANPIHDVDADAPYGDEMGPSAIYQWVWEGKLDLVKQAVKRSVGNVPLWYVDDEGRRQSPMLALALSRNHLKIGSYMIKEHGASLDDFSGEGMRCREYASNKAIVSLLKISFD